MMVTSIAARSNQPQPVVMDNLTQQGKKRLQVCMFLRGRLNKSGKKLDKFAHNNAAAAFGLKPRGISGIWWRYKKAIVSPETVSLDIRRKVGTGKQALFSLEEVYAKIKEVHFHKRTTLRSLSAETGIGCMTLERH